MSLDYNQTLKLPKTDFPMRASLPQREPLMLEQWEEQGLYYKMIENNASKPLYVFHDGPPYANADIHLGTALNKILKDVIVRFKNISGYKCNYIPGWDTHGLPIELKAMKEIGLKEAADPVKLRRHCRDFALFHVENQKKQFKRLGTIAHYDDPYLTLAPEYEALQIEIFGAMAEKGYIYKDLKSVHWCPECTTALAEAEIEYQEDPCDSIYVKFPIKEDKNGALSKMGVEDISNAHIIIWTTTNWTLPANLAVCLGPEFEYSAVRVGDEYYIIAKELVEAVIMQVAGIKDYERLGSVKGKELEYVLCRHPFLDRDSLVVVGDHVTLESGTGCVHTAPGHGVEDFDLITGKYPQLGCLVPVDEHGKMTAEAGDFIAGLPTGKANGLIAERLKKDGMLFAVKPMVHQYPHCWRCKAPVLYRATEQWFCNVDDFKKETVEEIGKVHFIPEWGRGRMQGMVEDRNAWCLSRQRTWGVPIPAFYCKDCGQHIINAETTKAIADLFRNEGSDAWYIKEAGEILPDGFACPQCGKSSGFTKETDIMDVWFDSGVSHAATLTGRWPDQTWPADLYLEGTDQYRGWFQSALLTAVAWKGQAPYKAVCSHGWVVDGEGRKMSKSLGNGIEPAEIIKEFGADILRLWVVSSDYHADIRISKDILKQLSEIYRKIRNTARFILGNLEGFDPDLDCVSDGELLDLDKWALARLDALLDRTLRAYDKFEFHVIFHAVHNFCTIDMSNFYLDVIKDRLYVSKAEGIPRRAAQTVMYRILRALTTIVAPIIPFTAEEIWSYIPESAGYNKGSVMFNDIPKPTFAWDDGFMERWDKLIAVRDDVNKALEFARAGKQIGKSLEAKAAIYCKGELLDFLKAHESELDTLFIVSQVELRSEGEGSFKGEVEGLSLEILPAQGAKCERCWIFSTTVGEREDHKTICKRCAEVVTG